MERNSGDGMDDPRRLSEGLSLVTATWESELAGKRLGEADIDGQSSADLANSLTRLDELLDPSLLPPLWIDISSDPPTTFTNEGSAPDQAIKVTPESLLRGRRAQILRQLKRATEAEKVEMSRKLAEKSPDDPEISSIEDKLERLNEEEVHFDELRNEGNARSDQRAFALEMQATQLQADIQAIQLQADIDERERRTRTELWLARLSRDSIAAIVGGVLLISFAIAVIVAMFTGTEITDVVQNSFLLILGYFFGAAVARRPSSASDQDAPRAPTP